MSIPDVGGVLNAHAITRFIAAPTLISVTAGASAGSGALATGVYRVISDVDVLLSVDTDEFTTLQAMSLVNDLVTQYEAHRVLITDSVHQAADTTNEVTAATATNLATAITLANDLKAQYEAHRADTTPHAVADSTNTVSADDATTLATLITLVNELRTDYEAHRVLTGGSEHGAADATNAATVAAVTQLADATGHFLPARSEILLTIHGEEDTVSAINANSGENATVWVSRAGAAG